MFPQVGRPHAGQVWGVCLVEGFVKAAGASELHVRHTLCAVGGRIHRVQVGGDLCVWLVLHQPPPSEQPSSLSPAIHQNSHSHSPRFSSLSFHPLTPLQCGTQERAPAIADWVTTLAALQKRWMAVISDQNPVMVHGTFMERHRLIRRNSLCSPLTAKTGTRLEKEKTVLKQPHG